MEGKQQARIDAERRYTAAIAAVRAAEDVSESAWLAAKVEADVARKALIEAETAYPTQKERARAANILRLRNRGIDC